MIVMSMKNLSELYPVRMEQIKTDLERWIELRIEHIEKRIKLFDNLSRIQLSPHGDGFAAGQVHRLIAERYFLESLIEKLDKE